MNYKIFKLICELIADLKWDKAPRTSEVLAMLEPKLGKLNIDPEELRFILQSRVCDCLNNDLDFKPKPEVAQPAEHDQHWQLLRIDDEMPFGKYKGQLVRDICDFAPSYMLWFNENITKYTLDAEIMNLVNKTSLK